MGADSFYVYYGIVRRIPLDSPEIEQLECDEHPAFELAFEHKLHATWGVPWEGEPAFLLIGTQIGVFGAENGTEGSLSDRDFSGIQQRTRERLRAAGFAEEPQLHCQFELDQ